MPSPLPQPSAENPLRILYLEDHAPLRLVISEGLQRAGYHVEDARDGAEGWRKFSSGSFDLVITDLQMPNLDGFGFIHLLRESKRPVRVIVYSASLADSNQRALRNLAVDAIIPKDLNWNKLKEAIVQVTGAPS